MEGNTMGKTAQRCEEIGGSVVGRNRQEWAPPRLLRFVMTRAEFLNGPGGDGVNQS
jgi:hypothetical protein